MERRERTFPMQFVITRPTRTSPGSCQMYYAHEWEALQKSLHSDQQPDQENDRPPGACAEPPQTDSEPAGPNPSVDPASESAGAMAAPADNLSAIPQVYPQQHAQWASRSLPPDFSRHSRRCAVCSHPDRDAIEGDFIRWRSPEAIAGAYKLRDRSSIYRHAHSTGLFAWRKQELGRVLEGILESSEHLPLESADVIIRAARIYSHLDEEGNWFEPPRTNIILTGPAPPIYNPEHSEPPAPAPGSKPCPQKALPALASNRNRRHFKKSVKSRKPKEKANS